MKKETKKITESKEHKKNWREVNATPEEIEAFLKDNIYLRRNLITLRTEWREPSGYERDGTNDWQPMNDWKLNTLWKRMSKVKPVLYDHMKKVINSDSFPDYHPFRYYLEHLPPWDRQSDYILEMSLSVNVRGDAGEQLRFAEYLKKWLVAMVDRHDGEVPSDMNQLLDLPGVGRKAANVIQSVAFGKSALAVDTHVYRVAHRLGLVSKQDNTPYKVEQALIKHIPEADIPDAHHWLLLHGRYVCTSRKPHCEKCELEHLCPKLLEDSKI